jgi:hypothetical protein
MTLSSGNIIANTDLTTTFWDDVTGHRALVIRQSNENLITAVFDDGYNAWDGTTPRASYYEWVPITDTRLDGLVVVAAKSASGNVTGTIQISSSAQGIIYTGSFNVIGNTTQTRTNLSSTFESRVICCQAGDVVSIKFTGSTATVPIELVRVHLMTTADWIRS